METRTVIRRYWWTRLAAGAILSSAMVAPLLCDQAPASETLTPAEEQQTFQLADGFQINLYASEADHVLNPLAMRWGPNGRLYVISTLAYPQLPPGEIANDKIILLEDVDYDGRVDKSTVFADGLNIPTGLEFGDGGLYVGQQTELLFFKDTDGDGQADERRVVLSGFGVGDTHQAINSFVWSPGGELFFGQGDGIESRVETPWGVASLFQAGVLRFRPKRLQLDAFLDDFMGPGNPWGIAFDDWGQTFVVDGAGGVTFLSPAALPVKNFQRLREIGKPGGYCGVEVLGSGHLPQEYQGNFLVGDFHRNRISCFQTVSTDSGFDVQWKPPLLVSSHRNFRPIDVRTGPDGAIYVCDWYNSVICHQDDRFRDPTRDVTHGRIWRITRADTAVVPRTNLNGASLEQLFESLASPERWIRYQAKRVLAGRPRLEVGARLRDWWASNAQDNEQLLYQLVGVLESVEVVDQPMLEQLLAANDPRARAYGARVVGRWCDHLDQPLALLEKCVHDEHPRVRMEAVVACAYVADPRAVEIAAGALEHPLDYNIDYALTQAIHHLKQHWIPAFQRGELTFDGSPSRLTNVLQRVDSPELILTLRDMAVDKNVSKTLKPTILQTLARIGHPKDLALVLAFASDSPKQSEPLLADLEYAFRTNSVRPSGDTDGQLSKLMAYEQNEVRARAIHLAGLWQRKVLSDRIRSIAASDQQANTVRQAAIDALANYDDPECTKALQRLAQSESVATLRLNAIGALCRTNANAAAGYAATLLKSDASLGDTHLARLLQAFASRQTGLDHLADQIDQAGLSRPVATQLMQALSGTGIIHERMVAVLSRQMGISTRGPEFSKSLVEQLTAQIADGDPIRGEQVFRSKAANCYSCHSIGGAGGIIGPDLSNVGTTLPLNRLIVEVLWPQRQVKDGYQLHQVVTNDGQVIQGYRRRGRDEESIYLRTLDRDELVRISERDIDDEDEVGSAMPSNVMANLTNSDQIDLLTFLSQLGSPGEFNVGHANFIRKWELYVGKTEPKVLASKGMQGDSIEWAPVFAKVSGGLPIAELVTMRPGPILLRNVFQSKRHRQNLSLNDRSGVSLWVDGRPLDVDENIEVDLAEGTHTLTLLIDPTRLSADVLRASWQ